MDWSFGVVFFELVKKMMVWYLLDMMRVVSVML